MKSSQNDDFYRLSLGMGEIRNEDITYLSSFLMVIECEDYRLKVLTQKPRMHDIKLIIMHVK